jgi:hypothetical protein
LPAEARKSFPGETQPKSPEQSPEIEDAIKALVSLELRPSDVKQLVAKALEQLPTDKHRADVIVGHVLRTMPLRGS